MDQPSTFARHFSRLSWLLANEPSGTDDQKGALRALVMVAKDGTIRLSADDGRLTANGSVVPDAFTGVPELRERLASQGVTALAIDAGAAAAELLAVARLLSAPDDGGPPLAERAGALALRTVRLEGLDGVAAASPGAVPAVPAAPAAPDAPPAAAAPPEPARPEDAFLLQDTGAMYSQFMSASRPMDATEVLFARVDAASGSVALAAPLEELVNVAELNAREGRPALMADIFAGFVKREAAAADDGTRRAFAMSIRRISTAFMLNAVAGLLPRARGKADDYRSILVRAGEHGADALIEQLSQAQTAEDRRAYFDVLLTLGEGVPALVHMLGDARWFVVRNAAELLGEMQAVEAEGDLTACVRHADERVRRAVKVALTRIGTPTALRAIESGLTDPNPLFRQEAAAALAARRTPRSAQALIRALEAEEDLDVQLSLVAALGKIGSADAVQRLLRAAEPEGRLFRRKSTPLRVAAVQALAESRTPEALAGIATLTDDKEREVRELAARALAAASR